MRGKVTIEGTQIKISTRPAAESDEHIIENDRYVLKQTVTVETKSCLYTYTTGEKVLVSIVKRFHEEYYKIVIFDDKQAKAWNLLEISALLDVKVKRLNNSVFVVSGSGRASQISFCRLKPSTAVEEFTISFNKLHKVVYFEDSVAVRYSDVCPEDGKEKETSAVYNFDGKLLHSDVQKMS